MSITTCPKGMVDTCCENHDNCTAALTAQHTETIQSLQCFHCQVTIETLNGKVMHLLAERTEQNFCSRCGKRTKNLTHIHTCTPPQENT